jgi:hypothetical protein
MLCFLSLDHQLSQEISLNIQNIKNDASLFSLRSIKILPKMQKKKFKF